MSNITGFSVIMPKRITKGSINRMLKYYRRKKVRLAYDQDCSNEVGQRQVAITGTFESFRITPAYCGFNIRIDFLDGQQFDEFFEGSASFAGLGHIQQGNGDGTYTNLTLKVCTD